jgi:D-alanyl-D-alanine carboxypeptidase
MTTNKRLSEKLQNIANETVDNSRVFGTVFTVSKGNDGFSETFSAGNLQADSHYFMASATKLYFTTVVMNLIELGYFQLDTPIASLLPEEIVGGLHIYNGLDYSELITIEHLLGNTSGIPDYFQQKLEDGDSLLEKIKKGEDLQWTFEDTIRFAKGMKPEFEPGAKGKAAYSDTNFQLLGKIIEESTGFTQPEALDAYIFTPLELTETYLYNDVNDHRPTKMYYKESPIAMPKAMISFGPDGGMVSNSSEMNVFLRAFFNGELFPEEYLSDLYKWNSIFYPLEYGLGISRFVVPKVFSPFKKAPEFIGHSGLSGAFAFHNPEKDLYITGTVNQLAHPDIAFRMMVKIQDQF